MTGINIVGIKEYANAKEGSLLIKRNGKWVTTTFEELNKTNNEKLKKLDELEIKIKGLSENSKHFIKYAKSHFLVVFNYFKIKILAGEIDVLDEEILKLDELVLNNQISVQDALNKHELLKEIFNKLYSDNKEMIEFPEV